MRPSSKRRQQIEEDVIREIKKKTTYNGYGIDYCKHLIRKSANITISKTTKAILKIIDKRINRFELRVEKFYADKQLVYADNTRIGELKELKKEIEKMV